MIPKQLHLSWKTKDVVKDSHPLIENGVKKFLSLNPDWTYEISVDEEIDEYLKCNLDSKDFDLIKNKHIVEKTDLWRLIKLYNCGGMYCDIDRLCNKNISSYFTDKVKWILPVCRQYDFSHDIMITDSNNPVFLQAIKFNLQRRSEGCNNIYFLGTQTYMHAITILCYGVMMEVGSDPELFENNLTAFDKIPFITIYREDPPHNTLLYEDKEKKLDWEGLKRNFYKSYDVKHWTGEW